MEDYLNQDNLGNNTQKLNFGSSEDRTSIKAQPAVDLTIHDRYKYNYASPITNEETGQNIKFGFTPNDFYDDIKSTPDPVISSTFLDPTTRSKYDINPDYYMYNMFGEEHNRAVNQPFSHIAGNAAAKFGVTAAASAIDVLLGDVVGLAQGGYKGIKDKSWDSFKDGFINNALSTLMSEWKEKTYENFQVYNDLENQEKRTDNKLFNDFSTMSFWADDVITNAGYTVGIGMGIALGKGVGTKLARKIGFASGSYDIVNKAAQTLQKANPTKFSSLTDAQRAIMRGVYSNDLGIAQHVLESAKKINRVNSFSSTIGLLAATSSEAKTEAIEVGNQIQQFSDDYIDSEEGNLHFMAKALEKVTGKTSTDNPVLLKSLLKNLSPEEMQAVNDEAINLQDDFKAKSAKLSLDAQTGLYLFNFPILTVTNMVMYGRGLNTAFKKVPGALPGKGRKILDPRTWKPSIAADKAGTSSFLIKGNIKDGFKINKLFANKAIQVPARIVGKGVSEMGEEMFQQLGTDAATIKYKSDMNAFNLDLLGFKYDPEVKQVGEAYLKGLSQATVGTFYDTMTKTDTWLQGMVGFMTGIGPRVSMSKVMNKINNVKTEGGLSEWFEGGIVDAFRESNESIALARETIKNISPIVERIKNSSFHSYLGANLLINEAIKEATAEGNVREAEALKIKGIVTDYLLMQEVGKHNEYIKEMQEVILDIDYMRNNPKDLESSANLIELLKNIKENNPENFKNRTDESILKEFRDNIQEAITTSVSFNTIREGISNIVGDINPELRDELAFKTLFIEKNQEAMDNDMQTIIDSDVAYNGFVSGLRSTPLKGNVEFNKEEAKKEGYDSSKKRPENLLELVKEELGVDVTNAESLKPIDISRIIDFLLIGKDNLNVSPEQYINDLVKNLGKDNRDISKEKVLVDEKGKKKDALEDEEVETFDLDDDEDGIKKENKESEEKEEKEEEKGKKRADNIKNNNNLAKLLLGLSEPLQNTIMDITNSKLDVANYMMQLAQNDVYSSLSSFTLESGVESFKGTIKEFNNKQEFKRGLVENKSINELVSSYVKQKMASGSSFIDALKEAKSFLFSGFIAAQEDLVFLGAIKQSYLKSDIETELRKLDAVITLHEEITNLRDAKLEELEQEMSPQDASDDIQYTSLQAVITGLQTRFDTIPANSDVQGVVDFVLGDFSRKEFPAMPQTSIDVINEVLDSDSFLTRINQVLQDAGLFTKDSGLTNEEKDAILEAAVKRGNEELNRYAIAISNHELPTTKEKFNAEVKKISEVITNLQNARKELDKKITEKTKEFEEASPEEYARLFTEITNLDVDMTVINNKLTILKEHSKNVEEYFKSLEDAEARAKREAEELKELLSTHKKERDSLNSDRRHADKTLTALSPTTVEELSEALDSIDSGTRYLNGILEDTQRLLDSNLARIDSLTGFEKEKELLNQKHYIQYIKRIEVYQDTLNGHRERLQGMLDEILSLDDKQFFKALKTPTREGLEDLIKASTDGASFYFRDELRIEDINDFIDFALNFKRQVNNGFPQMKISDKHYQRVIDYATALKKALDDESSSKNQKIPIQFKVVEGTLRGNNEGVTNNIPLFISLYPGVTSELRNFQNDFLRHIINSGTVDAFNNGEISLDDDIYVGYDRTIYNNGSETDSDVKNSYYTLFLKVGDKYLPFNSMKMHDSKEGLERGILDLFPEAMGGLKDIAKMAIDKTFKDDIFVIPHPIGKLSGYMSSLDITKGSKTNIAHTLFGKDNIDLNEQSSKENYSIFFYTASSDDPLVIPYGQLDYSMYPFGESMVHSKGTVFLGVLDKAKNTYVPSQIDMKDLSSFELPSQEKSDIENIMRDILSPMIADFNNDDYGESPYLSINLGDLNSDDLSRLLYLGSKGKIAASKGDIQHSEYEIVLRKDKNKVRVDKATKEKVNNFGAVTLNINRINESRTAYAPYISAEIGNVENREYFDLDTGETPKATSNEELVESIIRVIMDGNEQGKASIRFNVSNATTPSDLNTMFATQAITAPGLNSLDIHRTNFAATFDTNNDYGLVLNQEKLESGTEVVKGKGKEKGKKKGKKEGVGEGTSGKAPGKLKISFTTLEHFESLVSSTDVTHSTEVETIKNQLGDMLKNQGSETSLEDAYRQMFSDALSHLESVKGSISDKALGALKIGKSNNATKTAILKAIERDIICKS